MSNPHILVSGPTIAADEDLINKLQKIAVVLKNPQNSRIESILENQRVDLILFELLRETASETKMVKKIKKLFPNTAIVLIDGDRELLAEALSCGAKDAFRKPYKSSLIVERVKAILAESNNT
ncbi:MAG: hypothetical protein ACE5HO_18405 [bacterium]